MTRLQTARIVVPVSTIIALHVVVVSGHMAWAPAVLASLPAGHLALAFVSGATPGHKLALMTALALLVGLQILVLAGDPAFARAIALPPALIHGWLAWTFGRSLLPGNEPLIRRFSRMNRGTLPPELEGYTRRLTGVWAAMFVGMFGVSVAVGINGRPETWSWVVNIALPLATLAVFLGEHGYRAVVYRHLGHNSPLLTLRVLARRETWAAP